MKIALASDHGGWELKEAILVFLRGNLNLAGDRMVLHDFGCYDKDPAEYVPLALTLSGAVACGEYDFGILCCGTGIGMSIAANKVKGIRAACCSDYYSVKMTREHNDANVLCLGGRVLGGGAAIELVKTFLTTKASAEARHQARVKQLDDIIE